MPEPGDSRGSSATGFDRLTLSVVRDDGDWGDFEPVEDHVDEARRAVQAHNHFLTMTPSQACVALSSDSVVANLNATYRGRDMPTNVLSFPAGAACVEGPGIARALGDIILAEETVLREAREQGIVPSHYLQHLVVHGLLHLLGYDHETDAQAGAMESLEIEILASLGIASPYADGADVPIR